MAQRALEVPNVWVNVLGLSQMLLSAFWIQSMQQFELIQQMKLIIRGLHRQLKQLTMKQQLEKEELAVGF
jgi:hypothetical protein